MSYIFISIYRERYKAQYEVEIFYDQSLIADDVYPIHDMTEISLVGLEANARKLQSIIEEQVEALNVLTLQVTLTDGKILKENIYSIKTQIDPAEVRIKRTTNHTEMKDLNHPFYFIPNYTKDVLIIGYPDEVHRAEGILNDFLSKRYNSKRTYTLSHLLPFNMHEHIKRIRLELIQSVPAIQVFVYEPNPPRKHITVLLLGTWADIRSAKRLLDKQLEKINQGALSEFQGFVMLQQVRFTYKNLKRFLLENNTKVIKHWDLNSSMFCLPQPLPIEAKESIPASKKIKTHIVDPLIKPEDKLIQDDVMRKLVYSQMEPETIVNLLFASGKKRIPSLLQDIKITKKNLIECLSSYLKDTVEAYNQSVVEENYMQDLSKEKGKVEEDHAAKTKRSRSKSRSKSRGRKRSFSRSRSRSRSRSKSRSRSNPHSNSSKRRSEEHRSDRRKHHHHRHHRYSPKHSRRRPRNDYSDHKESPISGEPCASSDGAQNSQQLTIEGSKFKYKSYHSTLGGARRGNPTNDVEANLSK